MAGGHPKTEEMREPCTTSLQTGTDEEKLDTSRDDARLIAQCLAGDCRAWETLYDRCHPLLTKSIRTLLGPDGQDPNLVDEIAARVWYTLLRDDARVLGRYNPKRDCRFVLFLVGLARYEILQYMRSERRRRHREFIGGQRALAECDVSEQQMAALISDFAVTLTRREREFLEKVLLVPYSEEESEETSAFSSTNKWQQSHRIRCKARAFFEK